MWDIWDFCERLCQVYVGYMGLLWETMSRTNESCRTYQCQSCLTYDWVMSHIWINLSHIWMTMSHISTQVTSHVWMSHVSHMNQSCLTHRWVTSHTSRHIHESWCQVVLNHVCNENWVTKCWFSEYVLVSWYCSVLQCVAVRCRTLQCKCWFRVRREMH